MPHHTNHEVDGDDDKHNPNHRVSTSLTVVEFEMPILDAILLFAFEMLVPFLRHIVIVEYPK